MRALSGLSNRHFAWITRVTMCFYHDGAQASGEIIWQPKNNLRERQVAYWANVFGGDVVVPRS